MPTLRTAGASLDYDERGSGEPLVFVHGSVSDSRTWRVQQEECSQHFRAISYSRRYHWPNEAIPEGADYSMQEHVEDLRELIQRLDAVPAHLAGHSYGGFVCLLLAIQAPHLVRTLVLSEPPVVTLFVSNSPRPSEILSLLLRRPRTAAAILNFGAQGVGPATAAARRGDIEEVIRVFGIATLGAEAFHSLSDSRLEQVRANLIPAEFLGSGFAPLDPEQVSRVHAPTLLVGAQRSPALFHRLLDRLEELLPRAERIRIPDASHITHEDNAPAYNSAVLSFLAKHAGI